MVNYRTVGQRNQCKVDFSKWVVKYFLFLLRLLTLTPTSCLGVRGIFLTCSISDYNMCYFWFKKLIYSHNPFIHFSLCFFIDFVNLYMHCFYFLFSFNIYDYCIFHLLTWLPNVISWELRREREAEIVLECWYLKTFVLFLVVISFE